MELTWFLQKLNTSKTFRRCHCVKKHIGKMGSTNASPLSDEYSKQQTELIMMRNNSIPRNDSI